MKARKHRIRPIRTRPVGTYDIAIGDLLPPDFEEYVALVEETQRDVVGATGARRPASE